MTRDDILGLAKESWGEGKTYNFGSPKRWHEVEDMFVRFAVLVAAAKEREMMADGWRHCAKGQRTTQFCSQVQIAVEEEREKLKHELLALEKWKGMALAKDGDGRTVQQIEQEARAAEREECANLAEQTVCMRFHANIKVSSGIAVTGYAAAYAIRARGQE